MNIVITCRYIIQFNGYLIEPTQKLLASLNVAIPSHFYVGMWQLIRVFFRNMETQSNLACQNVEILSIFTHNNHNQKYIIKI